MTAIDIIGIGVCTVDHIMTVPAMPGDNVNMRAGQYARQPGGLASCALAAAAKLGAQCQIIAQLGDDDDGQYIRARLHSEGIDTSLLLTRPGSQSQVSLILVNDSSGERSIVTRLPTGDSIAAGEIQRADIISARALFVDNINDATLQAASWARQAGMRVVLDPARPYTEIKPLLRLVDVPIVPEAWARAWLPDAPPAAVCQRLCAQGASIAAVTLGERGAVVGWDGQTRHFPAYAVDVVDTTGAGDAYHGAFLYALLQGWDVPRMARFAAAVGALNCRALGGRSALPTLDEAQALLAR